MALRDVMAADLAKLTAQNDFGVSATVTPHDAAGAGTFSLDLMPGDQALTPTEIENGIAMQTTMQATCSRAAYRAGVASIGAHATGTFPGNGTAAGINLTGDLTDVITNAESFGFRITNGVTVSGQVTVLGDTIATGEDAFDAFVIAAALVGWTVIFDAGDIVITNTGTSSLVNGFWVEVLDNVTWQKFAGVASAVVTAGGFTLSARDPQRSDELTIASTESDGGTWIIVSASIDPGDGLNLTLRRETPEEIGVKAAMGLR